MEKNGGERKQIRVCPLCGKEYIEEPALSRTDNTPICPDCGTRQSLEYMGVGKQEQDKIIETIHRYKGGQE